jgi:ATP-dependent DNA helicase RecG
MVEKSIAVEKENMALKSVESRNVEFKSNWRDEYHKVICAFANADGGKLMIAINEKGNQK